MEHHSLIERIKNKDSENGIKEIYSEYRNEFILWVSRNHSCTEDEAKDIFQQAVIIFYENIVSGKLTEISTQVKTYLFSIGKNKILEMLREKRRKSPQYQDDFFNSSELFYGEFDEGYEQKLNMVEASLATLGDPCKQILELYYYHKKSMQDISDSLDYKNKETVKNLKYKCLQRLKQIFVADFKVN